MRMFLRKTTVGREPLVMAMSGVRMGERLVQIGVDDPAVLGALAAKVGISGHAAVLTLDERSAGRARKGIAEAGALADVTVSIDGSLPFDADGFDVAIVHGVNGFMPTLAPEMRSRLLSQLLNVTRRGGRVIVTEAGERAGLFEQVRCAIDDAQLLLAAQPGQCLLIEPQHDRIGAADDQERWRIHAGQRFLRQIRPAPARDDGRHLGRVLRHGDQRRRRTGAGAEVADLQPARGRLAAQPLRDAGHPAGEQVDVEAEFAALQIGHFFPVRQQVEQQRRQAALLKVFGDLPVPRAVPAASAAVHEQHDAAGRFRNRKIAVQYRPAARNAHRLS